MLSHPAIFFDGVSNRRRTVEIRCTDKLEIHADNTHLASWSFPDIRIVDTQPGIIRLWSTQAPELARLEIRDAATRALVEPLCPNRNGPGSAQTASAWRIAAWSAVAAAVIAAAIWFAVPVLADEIADILPASWERPLGDAVDRQVRLIYSGQACTDPTGRAALKKLVARLQSVAKLAAEPDPIVLESNIPNAFALPGGRVYVLSALLEKARTPDELAGVLAHEFGHLSHRDGLRRLIRDGGTGYLAGLLFGDIGGAGAALFAARSLLNAAYSREIEANADRFAVAALQQLGRPTAPLGDLLTRIVGPESKTFSILSDHPLTPDRNNFLAQPAPDPPGPVL
ncbi:MAG: M48 family metallopeptidase, partial [Rhodospirillales bacterium]